LSDDKQRELYNQFGHAGVDPNFQVGGVNPFGGAGNPFCGGAGGLTFRNDPFKLVASARAIQKLIQIPVVASCGRLRGSLRDPRANFP
jgi:DnaJ-class molecular chaperone